VEKVGVNYGGGGEIVEDRLKGFRNSGINRKGEECSPRSSQVYSGAMKIPYPWFQTCSVSLVKQIRVYRMMFTYAETGRGDVERILISIFAFFSLPWFRRHPHPEESQDRGGLCHRAADGSWRRHFPM
jgi:hypothetical protein